MAVADRHGLPVAVSIESATPPHEVKLAESTLAQTVIPEFHGISSVTTPMTPTN